MCAAVLHCRSQGDGPRVARIVCPASHRRIIENGECSFGAFVREAEAAPSCGALHPLRPLSGPRVLQTAAPKISPCFCRWQRSSLLLFESTLAAPFSRQVKQKLRYPLDTGVLGGRGWIRTTEAESSRFTVCPHWPLGNTPIFSFAVHGLPVYIITRMVVCQHLLRNFWIFVSKAKTQKQKPPRNQRS